MILQASTMVRSTVAFVVLAFAVCKTEATAACKNSDNHVLILGAGIAGIQAGKKLTERGITNFLIIEGQDDIGGRIKSIPFGSRSINVEIGANWIQGASETSKNPILTLKEKYDLRGDISDYSIASLYTTMV